jgi:regulator of protease activity HflC (stomatin/prohibitin superfamily)
MRAEIGRLTLDRTLADRSSLNHNIVEAINHASALNWGIQCLRYEIRDIYPPEEVVQAMHSQVSAERQKRAEILASEGRRQAAINVAEGDKMSTILRAEGMREESINRAKGEYEAVLLGANASAQSIALVAQAIEANSKSSSALTLKVPLPSRLPGPVN